MKLCDIKRDLHYMLKNILSTHAQYIERNVMNGCTVNLCTIDLSKAFDKVNHHALFIQESLANANVKRATAVHV